MVGKKFHRFFFEKSNIDTKYDHTLREFTVSKPSFWVSVLVVGGCVPHIDGELGGFKNMP